MQLPNPLASAPHGTQLALLDACRGGAAIWVVMAHACLAYIANGHPELLSNPIYAFSVQGQIGVGFFFVISGYCIVATVINGMARGRTLRDYLVARCMRIYPPYLAALSCVVVTNLVVLFLLNLGLLPGARPPESPCDQGAFYWLTNILLVQLPAGNTSFLFVSWSLCYEIAFYVLTAAIWALCSLVTKGNGAVSLVTFLNVSTLISIVWVSVSKETCPFPLDRWYQFGLGIVMYVVINRRHMAFGPWLQVQVVTVMAATSVLAINVEREVAAGLFYSEQTLLFSLVGYVVVITAIAGLDHLLARNWLVSQFRKLGAISYSLYLIHMIPIPFVDAAMRRAGFQGPLYMINFLMQIATAIAFGWCFHRLVERRFIETKKSIVGLVPIQNSAS